MRRNGTLSRRLISHAALLCLLTLLLDLYSANAQYYQPGQVVTNFTLYARRQWTNLTGRVFTPGSPVQLTDFAGYVVFMEFFDPT